MVCTSQLNSESLALVRRKGVVKPAPGCLAGCLAVWLSGCLAVWLSGCLSVSFVDITIICLEQLGIVALKR